MSRVGSSREVVRRGRASRDRDGPTNTPSPNPGFCTPCHIHSGKCVYDCDAWCDFFHIIIQKTLKNAREDLRTCAQPHNVCASVEFDVVYPVPFTCEGICVRPVANGVPAFHDGGAAFTHPSLPYASTPNSTLCTPCFFKFHVISVRPVANGVPAFHDGGAAFTHPSLPNASTPNSTLCTPCLSKCVIMCRMRTGDGVILLRHSLPELIKS